MGRSGQHPIIGGPGQHPVFRDQDSTLSLGGQGSTMSLGTRTAPHCWGPGQHPVVGDQDSTPSLGGPGQHPIFYLGDALLLWTLAWGAGRANGRRAAGGRGAEGRFGSGRRQPRTLPAPGCSREPARAHTTGAFVLGAGGPGRYKKQKKKRKLSLLVYHFIVRRIYWRGVVLGSCKSWWLPGWVRNQPWQPWLCR